MTGWVYNIAELLSVFAVFIVLDKQRLNIPKLTKIFCAYNCLLSQGHKKTLCTAITFKIIYQLPTFSYIICLLTVPKSFSFVVVIRVHCRASQEETSIFCRMILQVILSKKGLSYIISIEIYRYIFSKIFNEPAKAYYYQYSTICVNTDV